MAVVLAFPAYAQDPVSLEVMLDGVPAQDGEWVLTLTVHAHSDLEEIVVKIEPSEGLQVVSGEPLWSGALSAGSERIVEVSLKVTKDVPQQVEVQAVCRLPDGKHFEKRVSRRIG